MRFSARTGPAPSAASAPTGINLRNQRQSFPFFGAIVSVDSSTSASRSHRVTRFFDTDKGGRVSGTHRLALWSGHRIRCGWAIVVGGDFAPTP
jgi:hypothetical protein